MFPSLRHRLIIFAAVAVGVLVWALVLGLLRPADGAPGLTLMQAWVGFFPAVLLVALAGLPVAALAVFASMTGNPLTGVFVVAASLCVLGWAGGPIDGFLHRAADAGALPAAYLPLVVEVLLWHTGVLALMLVIQKFRSPLRTRYPALAFTDHLGVDTHLRLPQATSLAAGAVAAVLSGALAVLLVRSSDVGQVTFGLLGAFTVGSLVAQLFLPNTNPMGVLLSPALVAVAAYASVMLRFDSSEQVLAAFYNMSLAQPNEPRLYGAPMALPIHYASAAVAGCALGVGWAQTIMAGSLEPAEPEASVGRASGPSSG